MKKPHYMSCFTMFLWQYNLWQYNLMKIRSLICSPLLVYCAKGDLKKPHYGSHVIDPIFHPMKMVITRIWVFPLTDMCHWYEETTLHVMCNEIISWIYNAIRLFAAKQLCSTQILVITIFIEIGHSKCLCHVI
jgi:hypothetical protein